MCPYARRRKTFIQLAANQQFMVATNEPQLSFENAYIRNGDLVPGLVHYPSEIDRQFDLIYSMGTIQRYPDQLLYSQRLTKSTVEICFRP